MAGTRDEVHLLLVGHSTGHVDVVKKNGAKDVILFTTEGCLEIARSLSKELCDSGINVKDTCLLEPFSEDSVAVMTETISNMCDEISQAGHVPVIGLTGGTNLMVAAMCLVATRKKLKCHYVCRSNDAMLYVDLAGAFESIGGLV